MHTFKENKQINKQEILNQVEIMFNCNNNENEERYEAHLCTMYINANTCMYIFKKNMFLY